MAPFRRRKLPHNLREPSPVVWPRTGEGWRVLTGSRSSLMIAEAVTTTAPAESGASERVPAPLIRKAAVLGAGTMGARIAAHLANAGLEVVLLDLPSEGAARSAIAAQALDALKKSKPAAFFDPSLAG